MPIVFLSQIHFVSSFVEPIELHSVQDDFDLNALGDTERSETSVEMVFGPYFLVDELGNFLVDELGNFLVAYDQETLYPQIIHSIQDDFELNAE